MNSVTSRLVFLALAFFFACRSGIATTLRPVTLDAQAAEADAIFLAKVSAVASEWREEAESKVIVTKVTFEPLKVYKGSPPSPITLEFLGGKIGDTEFRVDGIPRFKVGEESILFTDAGGKAVCPLIGWDRGRKLVHRLEDGTATVDVPPEDRPAPAVLNDGRALRVQTPDTMSLDAFEELLKQKLTEAAPK